MSLFTHRWTRSGQLAIVRDMTELSTIIIGSGPAGYTAAIYLARAGYRPTILAGELTPGGQLVNTTTVENYPGFPDGILGPELMDRMRDQAESFGASIEYLDVTSVDFSSSPKTVTCSDGSQYHADAVIITTGSQYRKLGIPGEAEYSGHGVSYCATCDGFFFKDKPIVVVGGGDSALEEALFLTRFGSSVTVLHRRDQFRASKIMVERVLNNPKITVKMNTVATAIRGQKNAAGAQTGADAVTAAAPAAQNTGNLLSLKTTPMLNVSGSALNAPSSTGISLSAKAETADDSAGFVDIRDTVTGETGTLPPRASSWRSAMNRPRVLRRVPWIWMTTGTFWSPVPERILPCLECSPPVTALTGCTVRPSVPQAWDAAQRWTHNPTWPHCTDPTAQLDLSAKSNLITDDDIASPAG